MTINRLQFVTRWLLPRKGACGVFIVLVLTGTLAELAGVSMFLPLLRVMQSGTATTDDSFSQIMETVFGWFGLPLELNTLLIATFLLSSSAFAMMFLRDSLAHWLFFDIRKQIRDAAYGNIMDSPYERHTNTKTGELLNVLSLEIDRVGHGIHAFVLIIPHAFLALVYTCLLLVVSWQLIWVVLIFFLLKHACSSLFIRRAARLGGECLSAGNAQMTWLCNTLKGFKLIKATSSEAEQKAGFAQRTSGFAEKQTHAAWNTEFLRLVDNLLTPTVLCCVIFIGVAQLKLDLASIIVFLVALKRIAPSLTQVNAQRRALSENTAGISAVEHLLGPGNARPISSGDREFGGLTQKITIEDLGFSYTADGEEVLKNVSITVECGERIALVGASGGGKSTLLNLILRLYDPTSGQIRADGVPIHELKIESWHEKIGVVPQSPVVFDASVAENIAFGLGRKASREEIGRAARRAEAHDFISALPEGYKTRLGEDGIRLSGGQCQRIAIARCFLREPEILLMDEPTSAMDSVTEKQIQRAIDTLSKNRTVLTIAHRLSTIRSSDRIYVMKAGRITEQGKHDDLLDKGGDYAEYFLSQVD